MKRSSSIANLAAALVKARAAIQPVAKAHTNPHFKSKYASLDDILDAVQPALAAQGLTLLQGTVAPSEGETGRVVQFSVETVLLHASGEWISNVVVMPLGKSDPQGAGAAITYGRRYGVSALLALATDEDDDANSAMPPARQAAPAPAPRQQGQPPRSAPNATPVGETARGVADRAAQGQPVGAPSCPICGSEMYDNRAENAKRKAEGRKPGPDFKCKRYREGCEGVVWPPRPEKPKARPRPVPDPEGFDEFPSALEDEPDLPF